MRKQVVPGMSIAAATPVLEGVYGGGKASLPMRGDPMSPDFDAFLVLPRAVPYG